MTRKKSKQELESAVEQFTGSDDAPGTLVVWEDEAGDWYREPDDVDPIPPALREEIDPVLVVVSEYWDAEGVTV